MQCCAPSRRNLNFSQLPPVSALGLPKRTSTPLDVPTKVVCEKFVRKNSGNPALINPELDITVNTTVIERPVISKLHLSKCSGMTTRITESSYSKHAVAISNNFIANPPVPSHARKAPLRLPSTLHLDIDRLLISDPHYSPTFVPAPCNAECLVCAFVKPDLRSVQHQPAPRPF